MIDQDKSMENLVPLAQIDRIAQEMGFGSLPVYLEVHDRKIVGVTGSRFRRKVFKGNGAEDIVADFYTDLQKSMDGKENGTMTFTVKLHKGEVKEGYIQENFRQVFQKKAD
jgi:hypothetical protein